LLIARPIKDGVQIVRLTWLCHRFRVRVSKARLGDSKAHLILPANVGNNEDI